MKTIDRYLAGIFFKNILIAVGALTALFFFQSLLSEIISRAYTPEQVLYYKIFDLPFVIVKMTPPGVLLATVLTLSGLSRTNELTALFSVGFGLKRIVSLLLSIVVMVSCLTLMAQDRILPPIFKHQASYYWRVMQKRPDFSLDIKQNKIWYRSKNLIYNLQRFDPKTQVIYGMSVYTFDSEFNLVQVIDAETAEYSTERGWRLLNGLVTQIVKDDPFPQTQKFKEQKIEIAETPREFQEIEKEVDTLRLRELKRYIDRIHAAGADTKVYEVKFHSKISLSFIPIIMCVLGVPFSTRGRREGGMARDLGLCLGLTFFYWLFFSIGLSLGTNGVLPPIIAAWFPSFIFLGLALFLIARQRN